jgi:hypothetical protein
VQHRYQKLVTKKIVLAFYSIYKPRVVKNVEDNVSSLQSIQFFIGANAFRGSHAGHCTPISNIHNFSAGELIDNKATKLLLNGSSNL